MVTKTDSLRKMPVGLFIILGLVVLAVVGGLAFWLGQRDTVRMTSEDKAFVEKTTGISSSELERIAEEGQRTARRLLEGQSAPIVPAVPTVTTKDEGWTKTFQTEDGPIEVKYIRTNSAKGKVAVWMDVDGGALYRNIQNISGKSLEGRWIFIINPKGEAWQNVITRELNPGQIERDTVGTNKEYKVIETYFEVTS